MLGLFRRRIEAIVKIARSASFTPEAFANCSPVFLQRWDQILNKKLNSERVRELVRSIFANTFGVTSFHYSRPRVEATLPPHAGCPRGDPAWGSN